MARLPANFYVKATTLAAETKINFPGLDRQIRDYYRQVSTGNQRIKVANERAIDWLTREASEHLALRIQQTGRRQEDPRNLERVVSTKALTSTWSTTGFQFFQSSKVNRTNVRRYWRVIERGSRYWVERSERTGEGLIFRGGNGGLIQPGGAHLAGTSEVSVIRARAGRSGARIRRPIPAYGYLDHARTRFVDNDIYRGILRDVFKNTPIRIP